MATVISSSAEQSLTLNCLSSMMAEMVDMGATVRSSMTRYVTTSFTYPPPSPGSSCSRASSCLPCAHCISAVIGCRHTGQGKPDTSVTFVGFPRHVYDEHRKYRFGGGGGGGGDAGSSSFISTAEGGAGLRSASRFEEEEEEEDERKKASSRARAPA
ncbi:hypothetical protein PR202_ga16518 [Eleusine coracana subsp. coracana]|uniref:Uncharacterized protein n=1 Tax=Eleusine coracana subsp. coracana TaxID=191504 RepID=A0AAV5CN22_ELECO|nr:hypothetical protein PR202_ga16518 [Eleusine coracana subsp. coracana]